MERITKKSFETPKTKHAQCLAHKSELPSSAALSVWSSDGKDTGDEAGSCGSSVCQTLPSSGVQESNSDVLPDPLASSLSRKAKFTLEEIYHHSITTF